MANVVAVFASGLFMLSIGLCMANDVRKRWNCEEGWFTPRERRAMFGTLSIFLIALGGLAVAEALFLIVS